MDHGVVPGRLPILEDQLVGRGPSYGERALERQGPTGAVVDPRGGLGGRVHADVDPAC
jgi:hypothetical protein